MAKIRAQKKKVDIVGIARQRYRVVETDRTTRGEFVSLGVGRKMYKVVERGWNSCLDQIYTYFSIRYLTFATTIELCNGFSSFQFPALGDAHLERVPVG